MIFMASQELVKKKDFVNLEFLGRNLNTNEVFDTNIIEEAKKIKLELSGKPLIVCVGEGMLVKGFDEALEGKEVGKKYSVKLSPENAFGKRDKKLVQLIPLKMFLAQKIMPESGMVLALDNNLVKVISVSGGRVMVDFNNPLAGKEVEYEFVIKEMIKDTKEKINSLQRFFFNQEFDFDLDEANKKLIFKDLKLMPVLKVFQEKFKDALGLTVEILEKPKKEEKKAEEKAEKIEKK